MTSLLSQFLTVVGYLWQFMATYLVPTSAASVTILHVAVWTPVVVGLVGASWGLMRHLPRRRSSLPVVEAPAAPRVIELPPKARGLSPERYAKRKRAARAKRRAEERRQAREEARAQARAQRAAESTQRAEARRLAQEEARAQRAAQRAAERAAAAETRRAAQEEARAQRAAQRAAERAQRAEAHRLAQEETRAQRAAQQAERPPRGRRVSRTPEEAAAAAEAKAQKAAERRAAQEETRAQRAAQRAAQGRPDPTTRAFGADPSRVYEFRYRVVSLDSLITSNTDSGAVNPAYDPTLQPRQRQRAASQRQIEQAARNLVPEALLWDFRALDKGAPIVGDDLQVESGNGRALALRRARQAHPEQWARYQEALRGQLGAAGLAESDLAGVESPVLVRERVTQVEDRAAFAREANAPPVLQMSTLETAMVDSTRISGDLVGRLAVREGQSIDQALRAKANADFVRGFVGTLSENEAALLLRKDGTLAQAGIRRIKAALFVRTFEGEAGERLAETFLEALDSDIKNFETALSASLPVLARAEHRIASGERAADLSIADDFSRALDMLARLREGDGLTFEEYLGQSTLFGRETTPFQEDLLVYFDEIGRSPKKIREFFEAYAAAVEDAPHPAQTDLFGESLSPSKEQLFERITKRHSSAAKLAA